MNVPRHALSLSQKLTLLLAGTASAALLVFAVAMLGIEAVQSRAALLRDVATQAELIAVTVAPALAFNDPAAARETLAALRARRGVTAAWLVAGGSTDAFAAFGRGEEAPGPPVARAHPHHEFQGRWLLYHAPVRVDDQVLGTLVLQADVRQSQMGLAAYAAVVALLLAVVLGLSVALATRLQRVVSRPVLALAQTARRVTEAGDYSLRARKQSQDEIGALTDDFNRMLAHVQQSDAALRTSEERFALALRGATDGLWDWEVQTDRVFYSPRWKEMLGYRADELEHHLRTWEALVHPGDREAVLQTARQRMAWGDEHYSVEFRMRHRDGRWVHILSRAIVVRDTQGRAVRVVGTHQDITARKAAEEQRDRFFNLSLDLLCVANLSGYFVRVNPAFTRVLGWTPQELLSRPILDFVHPEDREATREELARLARGENVVDFENRYLCRDGSVRVLSWNCPAPGRDSTELFAVARDVTAQRLAQRQLEESEKRFRTLAESSPIGIYLTGCDGDCRYVNRRWCEMTGLPWPQTLGDGWVQALHPDDRARVSEEWNAAVRAGAEFNSEYRYQRPDGNVCWVVGRAAPLRERDGLLLGYVGSVTDVTARKQLEQELLEISDREQARLAQEIHDGLCQHLVSTGFTARVLEQKLVAARQAEAAQARQVAELIDGAIAQAYDLVGGLFPAQLAGEGLASALQEFIHRASRQHQRTRFSLEYPEPIELDPAQATHLFRIAREALTNALKHAQPDHVRLRLLDTNGCVQLTIEDDGRAERGSGGCSGGYGLQMMRYRASLLGGTLELRHVPAGGTIVACVFRANRPESGSTEPLSRAPTGMPR